MRIIFLFIHLFLVGFLFAQTEQDFKLNQQELYFPLNINSSSVKFDDQLTYNDNLTLIKSRKLDTFFIPKELYLKKTMQLSAFSFNQDKNEETFIGVGNYEHFNNIFTYNKKDKMLFSFEVGLVKQSITQNSDHIDFHLSMRTLIEYKINKTFSAYMYGQYISTPLNKNESSFESFSNMNPLFLQNELGTGLRASYKNIKTDIGMKSIRDNQFNPIKSINTMDTKITIGF